MAFGKYTYVTILENKGTPNSTSAVQLCEATYLYLDEIERIIKGRRCIIFAARKTKSENIAITAFMCRGTNHAKSTLHIIYFGKDRDYVWQERS